MLHFIVTNFGAIVSLIGILASIVIGLPHLTSLRIRLIARDAVLFAQQYEAKQAALGNAKPAFDVLKGLALDYAQTRLPNMDMAMLGQEIESALALLKVQYPAIGKYASAIGYANPTSVPPVATSGYVVTNISPETVTISPNTMT